MTTTTSVPRGYERHTRRPNITTAGEVSGFVGQRLSGSAVAKSGSRPVYAIALHNEVSLCVPLVTLKERPSFIGEVDVLIGLAE